MAEPVVLVTGGAKGIGKAIAVHYLARGARVAVLDQDGEACEELGEEHPNQSRLLVVSGDVRSERDARACVGACVERFGELHGLVNNAGIPSPYMPPIESLPLEQWQARLDTHLTGAFLMTKHAVPHLRAARGAIVNIASTRALQSEPHGEAYAASKGGLVALTHALAVSLGPEIRVNCISPGWIDVSLWRVKRLRKPLAVGAEEHQQHPAGRIGRPEDVAELVDYLLDPKSEFMTGQNLVLDGGMIKKMVYV